MKSSIICMFFMEMPPRPRWGACIVPRMTTPLAWYSIIEACQLYDQLQTQTRTNRWEATTTAAPVATISREEFSCTSMFNASSNYSLNWRYIVISFKYLIYYCCVNNISKHEDGILHICEDILMCFQRLSLPLREEINCIHHITKGFLGGLLILYWPSYSCLTAWHQSACPYSLVY